jgi:O-acetyl-ADP-ribose deacetylase (regulator of RNase III)
MSTLKSSFAANSRQVIQVRLGDLAGESTTAIVNAANTHLEHGGGVAGAIVRRGGYVIQEESRAWVDEHGTVPVGQVAVTAAGKLACQYIIHAVGPIWRDGSQNEEGLLRDAAWNSLAKAHEMGLSSIAFPAISSGIFGFPKERCAAIMVNTAIDFCAQFPESPLQEIRFTNIDELTTSIFEAALQKAQKDRLGSG